MHAADVLLVARRASNVVLGLPTAWQGDPRSDHLSSAPNATGAVSGGVLRLASRGCVASGPKFGSYSRHLGAAQEAREQIAHRLAFLQGMAKVNVEAQRIVVAAALSFLRDDSDSAQLADDPMHRPLRHSDVLSHLPQGDVRVPRKTHQYMSVVAQERPRRSGGFLVVWRHEVNPQRQNTLTRVSCQRIHENDFMLSSSGNRSPGI